MRKQMFASAVAIAVMAPTLAFAQASTATGAVVGGPVGAVVGGTVGAAIGASAEPPAEVRTYVTRESVPSVRVTDKVVVGEPLPATVVLRPLPSHAEYSFAVVNEKRVIVEPKTRKVIQIIE